MCASWLAVFRRGSYGVRRMNSRSLHVLTHDLAADHVLGDDSLSSGRVDPIIQSCRAARARGGGKPATDCRCGGDGEDLSHQHVGALGTAPEAALPHQLGRLAVGVSVERSSEHLLERRRATAVAAFGTPADDDLEPTTRHQSIIAWNSGVSPDRARPGWTRRGSSGCVDRPRPGAGARAPPVRPSARSRARWPSAT